MNRVIAKKDPEYVSKTDIYAYRRCPYTFHLVESGQISREEAFSPIQGALMAEGIAFENGILAEMPTTERKLTDPLLREEAEYLYGVETIYDHELRIVGRPDGFDLTAHAPIEIKHRTRLDPMDRLELAFYWMLLASIRTSRDVEPYGYVDLMGGRRLTRVRLLPSHFAKVRALIDDVRRARRDGVEPLPCRCYVCDTRPEVQAVFRSASDVGLILGIKNARAEALRRVGIRTVAQFVDADPVVVSRMTKEATGQTISAKVIAEAQPHARALRDGIPVWLSEERLSHPKGFIALDLEYVSGLQSFWGESANSNEIFLVGALLVAGERETLEQTLCMRNDDLYTGLRRLARLIRSHPGLPIYTWNGTTSDLRYLERAIRKYALRLMPAIRKRHVDLLLHSRNVVRLPIVGLGLKPFGAYLGVTRSGDFEDGHGAVSLYMQMKAARGKRRQAIADDLLRYNAEDLRALAAAARFLANGVVPSQDRTVAVS